MKHCDLVSPVNTQIVVPYIFTLLQNNSLTLYLYQYVIELRLALLAFTGIYWHLLAWNLDKVRPLRTIWAQNWVVCTRAGLRLELIMNVFGKSM